MSIQIQFVPGTDRKHRASYLVESASIPAAVVTRFLKAASGLSGAKLDRVFYQTLGKYPGVLDAIDTHNLTSTSAIETFQHLHDVHQAPVAGTGKRATKVEKAAEVFAKGICKRFKGSAEEMVADFLEVVTNPEFKKEVVDVISVYERTFGKTGTGFIKTSKRKGNPKAQAALEANREAKKAKKK